MALTDSTHVDNKLPERAMMSFSFPQRGKGPIIRLLPFFENPTIQEKHASNLIKYDVLGRSGQLFGHTGAKSRSFTVDFHITLPHLVDLAGNQYATSMPTPPTDAEKREAFFNKRELKAEATLVHTDWSQRRKKFLKLINNGHDLGMPEPIFDSAGVVTGSTDPAEGSPDYELARKSGGLYWKDHIHAQGCEYLLFWVDLIRSSVLNNLDDPTLGPPIVKFTFGAMYNAVPTIVEHFSISVDEMAGYDVVSLLPNRIKVTLALLEIKSQPGGSGPIEDTIYGWEELYTNEWGKKRRDMSAEGLLRSANSQGGSGPRTSFLGY